MEKLDVLRNNLLYGGKGLPRIVKYNQKNDFVRSAYRVNKETTIERNHTGIVHILNPPPQDYSRARFISGILGVTEFTHTYVNDITEFKRYINYLNRDKSIKMVVNHLSDKQYEVKRIA